MHQRLTADSIVTYEALASEKRRGKGILYKTYWWRQTLDEGHSAKNIDAQRKTLVYIQRRSY
jgi:SNF2 family DNA or RNA helicase